MENKKSGVSRARASLTSVAGVVLVTLNSIVSFFGDVTIILLWILYCESIAISLPHITDTLSNIDPQDPANWDANFDGENIQNHLHTHRGVSIAFNVFGWIILAAACINIIVRLIDTVLYDTVEGFLSNFIDGMKGMDKRKARKWMLPFRIASITMTGINVVIGLVRLLAGAGLLITAVILIVQSITLFLKKDLYCANSGADWNTTITGCGNPQYGEEWEWVDEKTCCGGVESLCCAFNAPYDYGLEHVPQAQLRSHPGDTDITRMEYILQMPGINIGERFYNQKWDPIWYSIMFSLIIFVNFWVASPVTTGFSLWLFFISQVMTREEFSKRVHSILTLGRKQKNAREQKQVEDMLNSKDSAEDSAPPDGQPVPTDVFDALYPREFRRLRFRPNVVV